MLTDSPYVNSDDHSLLRKFLQDDTVAAAQPDTALERFAREDPAIIALWDKLRAFQLTSPIEYAAAKAACKGVEIHYADASAEESHVADNAFYKRISGYGTAVQLAYEYRAEEAVMKFRDIRTLRALGNIATTMSAINETAPVLAYMGGIAHRKNIERVLNQHDIKFKSETFSPDRDQRNRRQNLRSLGHLATASWKTGIVDDPGKYYDKLWIANAQAQSAA